MLVGLSGLRKRIDPIFLGWILSLGPFISFIIFVNLNQKIPLADSLSISFTWIPSLGVEVSFLIDRLSILFSLLITGIGTLVLIYAGYYFQSDNKSWRFFTYLLLFQISMLGLVLADDLILLFIFWECTSVVSFLLIAYKTENREAQAGAFKSLLITGGGGILLFIGFLLLGWVGESFSIQTLLADGEIIRAHSLYPVFMILISLGAFTKSAQVPFHIWLPSAMSAPTPASAYLHSATMVKAGIYLLARLNPALGFTDLWFWVLSVVGLATMLTGAYYGLRQTDLKAILAYSTISQLGALIMLIGQDTSTAYKALVIGLVAHALYKCALFLVAGIVDHETGTRDIRKLGRLWKSMPILGIVACVASLSMAGFPPLFGFLAKETLLATVTHPSLPPFVELVFPAAIVLAGGMMIAMADIFFFETFLGKPKQGVNHKNIHEAPWGMLLVPIIPVVLSTLIAFFPEPKGLAEFFADAAQTGFGSPVKVSLALWTGISPPLILSGVAILLGIALFVYRRRVRAFEKRIDSLLRLQPIYDQILRMVDLCAYVVTRLQSGFLRHYLVLMLLFIGFSMFWLINSRFALGWSSIENSTPFQPLPFLFLTITIISAAATILLKEEFGALLALSVSGLGVALFMSIEPAPDLALVQFIADIVLFIILIFALKFWNPPHRKKPIPLYRSKTGLWRDVLISTGAGLGIATFSFQALLTRPRESLVTPFYEMFAKEKTGATDVVGSILLDFRGFDTFIEILVYAMAGLAVFALLIQLQIKDELKDAELDTPLIKYLGRFLFPLSLALALVHMIFGHDRPGDGFTAGILISAALAFEFWMSGFDETKRRFKWIHSNRILASGILIGIITFFIPLLFGQSLFSPIDFGQRLGWTLPAGVSFSRSFLFEISICLTVLGSTIFMLQSFIPRKNQIWN
ncbi:hypothetical protein BVX98_06955 [bacterium F11]|nr:hypothetical protein BVX98_06955 [bacterium F11]